MKYLRFVAPLVPFAIAWVIVALKLPPDAQYVGTDVGFSFISPSKHIFDLTWYGWSWYGAGSINLYNLSVAPFYVFVELFHLMNLSAVAISHDMEVLQFGGIGFGAYVLSAAVLGSERKREVLISLAVGLFAMFNYFGALALLVPASLFQPPFIVWPCLIAWEIRLFRRRRSFGEVAAFAFAVFAALSLNLAHTVVAVSLVIALAIATAISKRSFKEPLRVGGVVVSIVVLLSLPFWASIAAYHFVGGTPLIASANLTRFDALIEHIRISQGLSSFTGLFRLNTIVWWPALGQAKVWENPFVLVSTFALVALGVAGVLNVRFDFFTRKFWGVTFLVAVFLAKGIHAPFGEYYAKFLSLPMAEMLRESNDKFILVVYVAVIVLASIGLRSLRSNFARGLAAVALVGSVAPFFLDQPFLDGFIVRMPADYARVADLLGADPRARVFSVTPSNINEQASTYWFHGGNLDDALFHNPITYSTTFEAMGFSAASVYGDDRLVSAGEYFADRQIGKILGIGYILVHKDFTEGFDLGFSRTQEIHVNGQRIAQAVLRQCETDKDLELLFDGPYLRLYRVRGVDEPLAAISRLHAVRGYGNALFPLLELSPGNRGFVFSGTQPPNALDAVMPASYADRIETFVDRPSDLLTSDQILSSSDLENSIGNAFALLPVPQTSIASMPPGDYFAGSRGSDVMDLWFPIARAAHYPMAAFYRHRAGYSAVESNGLALVPSPPAQSPQDAGLTDPVVQRVITSKYLLSTDTDSRFPLAGSTRAFLTLSATSATFSQPGALELTVETDAGRSNVWIPLGDWESDTQAKPARTLLAALDLPDSPAMGSQDLDVMSAVVARSQISPGRALYRPGLRIVSAKLLLAGSPWDRLGRQPVASIRLYDGGPDDYTAQNQLASSQRVDGLAAGGATAPAGKTDVPGASVLSTGAVDKGTVVSASYRYPSWKTGQLVLVGHALLQPTGAFSALVTYDYAGKRYVKETAVSTKPEREPYGLLPLELDNPASAATSEYGNWTHFTIDLRALLPDLAQSSVEHIVVSVKLDSDSGGPVRFAFGPLEGYGDAARGYPLTTLTVNGSVAKPVRIERQGGNASVDFAPVAISPPGATIASGTLQANAPSAIRLGAPVLANATIAEGKLLDPTLGTIVVSSAGVIELGTMFNKGWVLRSGSPRPFGIFRELGAWFSTQPIAAPHFVADGFANAWTVPAGTYTVVFLPQVARDASVLALPAVLAIVVMLVLGWSVVTRRRRTAP